jgi:hypothetical protein
MSDSWQAVFSMTQKKAVLKMRVVPGVQQLEVESRQSLVREVAVRSF